MNLTETECRSRSSSTYVKASSRMKSTTEGELTCQTQSQMIGLENRCRSKHWQFPNFPCLIINTTCRKGGRGEKFLARTALVYILVLNPHMHNSPNSPPPPPHFPTIQSHLSLLIGTKNARNVTPVDIFS